MDLSSNFKIRFIEALAIAAASTVVLLIIICIAAQCGPRLCCGINRKERWFSRTLEGGPRPETPLIGQEKLYAKA
ncbi:hypothetical protein GGR56DRAFT_633577 [Xylariaceae sp. FL0804]|nr:hypothetical protein GGR56DRAFT_633577 [Xylariaceae sp. FL0804]